MNREHSALTTAIDLAKDALEERRPTVRAALVVHARAALGCARAWSGDEAQRLRTSPPATTLGPELGARTAAEEVDLALLAVERVLEEAERHDDNLAPRLPITDPRRPGPGRDI